MNTLPMAIRLLYNARQMPVVMGSECFILPATAPRYHNHTGVYIGLMKHATNRLISWTTIELSYPARLQKTLVFYRRYLAQPLPTHILVKDQTQ
jgi:hypothetical protein